MRPTSAPPAPLLHRATSLALCVLLLTALIPPSTLAQATPPSPENRQTTTVNVRIAETLEAVYDQDGNLTSTQTTGKILLNNTADYNATNLTINLADLAGTNLTGTITVDNLPPGEHLIQTYNLTGSSAQPKVSIHESWKSLTFGQKIQNFIEDGALDNETRAIYADPRGLWYGVDNQLEFNVTLANIGGANLSDVRVNDLLPEGLRNTSFQATTPGGTLDIYGAPISYDAATDYVTIPVFPNNTSTIFTLRGTLPAERTLGETVNLEKQTTVTYAIETVITQPPPSTLLPSLQQAALTAQQAARDLTGFLLTDTSGNAVDLTLAAETDDIEVMDELLPDAKLKFEGQIGSLASLAGSTSRAGSSTLALLAQNNVSITPQQLDETIRQINATGFPANVTTVLKAQGLTDSQIEDLRLGIVANRQAILNTTLDEAFRQLNDAYLNASTGFAGVTLAALENGVYLHRIKNRTVSATPADNATMLLLKNQFKTALQAKNWSGTRDTAQAVADWAWNASLRTGDFFYADVYHSALYGKIVAELGLAGDEAGALTLADTQAATYLFDDPGPHLQVIGLSSGLPVNNTSVENPNFYIKEVGVRRLASSENLTVYRIELPTINLGPTGPGAIHIWANGMETEATLTLGANQTDTLYLDLTLPVGTVFDVRPRVLGHPFAIYRPPPEEHGSHMNCQVSAWTGSEGTFSPGAPGSTRFNVKLSNPGPEGPCFVQFKKNSVNTGSVSALGWIGDTVGQRIWHDFTCTSGQTETLVADATLDEQGRAQHGDTTRQIFTAGFNCATGGGGPPPPQPPPDETDANITVRTTPPGATILMNGQNKGTSNTSFRVPPGNYSLSLTAPQPDLQDFTWPNPIVIECRFDSFQNRKICPGFFMNYNFILRNGVLILDVTDVRGRPLDDADVFLRNVETGELITCSSANGRCSSSLQPGNYTYTITKDGYLQRSGTVDIGPAETIVKSETFRNDPQTKSQAVGELAYAETVTPRTSINAYGSRLCLGGTLADAARCAAILLLGLLSAKVATEFLSSSVFANGEIDINKYRYPIPGSKGEIILLSGLTAVFGAILLKDRVLEALNEFNKIQNMRLRFKYPIWISKGSLPIESLPEPLEERSRYVPLVPEGVPEEVKVNDIVVLVKNFGCLADTAAAITKDLVIDEASIRGAVGELAGCVTFHFFLNADVMVGTSTDFKVKIKHHSQVHPELQGESRPFLPMEAKGRKTDLGGGMKDARGQVLGAFGFLPNKRGFGSVYVESFEELRYAVFVGQFVS